VVEVDHVVHLVLAHHVVVQRLGLGLHLGHVVPVEVHPFGVVPRHVAVALGEVVLQGEVHVPHGTVGVEHGDNQDVHAVEDSRGFSGAEVLDEFKGAFGGQLFVAVLLRQVEDGGVGRVRDVLHQVDVPALHRLADDFQLHGGLPRILVFQERNHLVVGGELRRGDLAVAVIVGAFSDGEGRCRDGHCCQSQGSGQCQGPEGCQGFSHCVVPLASALGAASAFCPP
jgi:hypothetical protein